MEYTFANPRVPPPPRQQTWPEIQIEASAKTTRQLHYLPAPTSQLEHWYLDEILDPYIAPRVQDLYAARQKVIHEEGVRRLSIWSDWWTARQYPSRRSRKFEYHLFVTACESTLEFMEDDYVKRKVDFVTEVYGVLVVWDAVCVLRRCWRIWGICFRGWKRGLLGG
jgi:hypothetical protein